MRRIRLPLGPSLFLLCAFLFALVALLPLRLALAGLSLDERGFAAREASGSIWLGRLSEARLGSVALGDLVARLSPVQLMIGRARIDLLRAGEGDRLEGAVGVTRNTIGLDDMTATLPVAEAFAPLPISTIELDDVSVRFRGQTCERAEGRVRATVGGDVAGLDLAQGLSGVARCDGGALLLPLASQSGQESLALRLRPSGNYEAVLSVRTADPALVDRLVTTGFAATTDGYALTVQGSF